MKRVLHIGKPMLFLPAGVRLIVNRDCSDLNVMYDAPGMYSEGFYPVRTDRVAIYDRQASSHQCDTTSPSLAFPPSSMI